MVGPLTYDAGYVVVTVNTDRDVEVRSDLARLAQRALLSPISAFSFQNLYKVTDDRIASVNRY